MSDILNLAEVRASTGLTQAEFWEQVGVTQATGSRYESGASSVPATVLDAVRLVFIDKVDVARIGQQLACARRVLAGVYDGTIDPKGRAVAKALKALSPNADVQPKEKKP